MKQTVLKYGLISGAVSAVLLLVTVPFLPQLMVSGYGAVVGYTGMLLAALLVFFGVRSYREQHGGTISFGRAMGIGALIVAVSALCYTLTWEAVYFGAGAEFRDKIVMCIVQHGPGQKPGSSGSASAPGAAAPDTPPGQKSDAEKVAEFRRMYDNPLTNSALTFTEPLPVGLIVSALSAAILRRKAAQ